MPDSADKTPMKLLYFLSLIISFSALSFTPPDFQSNILDEAGVLSESDKNELEASILRARKQADIWAAVYILPSLNGEPIDEVSFSTAEHWKIGKKGKDNGLLIVVAINDRKMRIEVGYGLEGSITDYTAHRVIQENLRPHFMNGDYATGLVEGLEHLVKVHLQEKVISSAHTIEVISRAPSSRSRFSPLRIFVGFVFNFSFVILFWAGFAHRKIQGKPCKLRWFYSLKGAHCLALAFFLFFSIFWSDTFFPFAVIAVFNGIFTAISGVLTLKEPIKILMSANAYDRWVAHWLKYEKEREIWTTQFKAAETQGTLLDFVESSPPPMKTYSLGVLLAFPSSTETISLKNTGTSGPSSFSRTVTRTRIRRSK
jgi:uncharacterized membrane protein YgcG